MLGCTGDPKACGGHRGSSGGATWSPGTIPVPASPCSLLGALQQHLLLGLGPLPHSGFRPRGICRSCEMSRAQASNPASSPLVLVDGQPAAEA